MTTSLYKTIDDITRTKTSLDGSERIPARDGDGDFKILASLFLAAVESEPVGTIKSWDKTFPNTPALSDSYVECDGSVISDSESVYNGYRSRNLNGANVVLALTWTADAGGAYATVSATDVTALAVGDKVSGSGITPVSGDNYTYITDITGTTVTISDVSASGTISSTFTNDGRFLRGATDSGDGQIDEGQGHADTYFSLVEADGANGPSFGTSVPQNGTSSYMYGPTSSSRMRFTNSKGALLNDGANGIPRNGEETRPINTGAVYIMKIK